MYNATIPTNAINNIPTITSAYFNSTTFNTLLHISPNITLPKFVAILFTE